MITKYPGQALALIIMLAACNNQPAKQKDHTIPPVVEQLNPMQLVPGGEFEMGADDDSGQPDEYPKHLVKIDSFWMDEHEVTNAEFAAFVKATGYITTAEKPISKEEIMATLPPGSPEPDSADLLPGSLVFVPTTTAVDLRDVSQWWSFERGASWQHPEGPGSDLKGKEQHPVVHISWDDAQAYAKWAGKRLPTEAEWEYAARGGLKGQPFPWGSETPQASPGKTNIWNGHFPYENTQADGFYGTAPAKSFAANAFKLYDMAGNVWEWTADWYDNSYYSQVKPGTRNPEGSNTPNDPSDDPANVKRVIRGGSFMCSDEYCRGYRVSARMKTTPSSGLSNLGFRCARSAR